MRPEHPALLAGGRALSYAQLDRAASVTARRLAALGVEPGDRVGASTLPAEQLLRAAACAAPSRSGAGAARSPRAGAKRSLVTVTGPLTARRPKSSFEPGWTPARSTA